MSVGERVDFGPDVEQRRRITDQVAAITERREPIQRAIGMLMLVYDLTPEQAFELLKWRSQHDNIKLRDLAEHLGNQLPTTARHLTKEMRRACDTVLHANGARTNAEPTRPTTVR